MSIKGDKSQVTVWNLSFVVELNFTFFHMLFFEQFVYKFTEIYRCIRVDWNWNVLRVLIHFVQIAARPRVICSDKMVYFSAKFSLEILILQLLIRNDDALDNFLFCFCFRSMKFDFILHLIKFWSSIEIWNLKAKFFDIHTTTFSDLRKAKTCFLNYC